MDLRTLRAFVEVVRQGGFSPAARTLFSTQSTVSKAVKQLEDEIGTPLLDRTGQRNSMTAAGEIVYRRALAMLAERDDLVGELDELRGLKRGTLRLGLPPVGSATVFAPLFATYRSLYPGIEVRLTERGADRLRDILLAGEIDLAGSLLPVPPDFEWQELRREPLVALLPEHHPLAHAGPLTLPQLARSPFVLFETGFALNRIVLAACRRHGFQPGVAARSSQIDFIAALVAAGMGTGFLPRMLADQHLPPGVRAVPLAEDDMVWHLAMIWRRGAFLSHAARAWLSLARLTASEVAGSDAASPAAPAAVAASTSRKRPARR